MCFQANAAKLSYVNFSERDQINLREKQIHRIKAH